MRLTLAFSLVCQLALLSACEKPAPLPSVSDTLPNAVLSSDRLSFGELNLGDSASRQMVLENTGELPMGIGQIVLNADGQEANFAVTWSADAITCPASQDDQSAARAVPDARVAAGGSRAKGSVRVDTWDTGGSSGGGSSGGGSSGGGSGGSTDTGGSSGGGTDGTDGADGSGDGGGETPADTTVILDQNCKLPITITFTPLDVGSIFGSISIDTITQSVGEDKEAAYHRDPDQFHQVVLLDGAAFKGTGNVIVRPANIDMGHLFTGESTAEYVTVNNVGDGDLTLGEPSLLTLVDTDGDGIDDAADVDLTQGEDSDVDGIDDRCDTSVTGGVDANGDLLDDTCRADCDAAFSIDLSAYDSDRVLPGGDSTLFKVNFSPEDLDGAFCTITVPSSDIDTPIITVKAQGNVGTDPENEPPVVQLLWPPVGYVHTSTDDLVLELDIHDANQPADTLICKVRSLLKASKVADCKPSDESGHVYAHIPIDLLEDGTDTLLVTVTDQSERLGKASTTVLWKALYPSSDDDGDGWGDDVGGSSVDCDDDDATIYPSAAELPDGKDNDCDNAIDEGTVMADEDGDSVTPEQGDCDDSDSATYPRAMEQPDQKDNDCDGVVDEGTGLVDDDGDGFTELNLDCDDDLDTVNPAAVELCDGLDNNCNGYIDSAEPLGCQKIAFEPMIYGGVRMTQNAIGVGESTTMTVSAFDADGQALTFLWQEDSDLSALGHTAIDNVNGQTITWTAPAELPEGSTGEVFGVVVVVSDEDGNQAWAFGDVSVYPEAVTTTIEETLTVPPAAGGCGSSGSSSSTAGLLPALPVLGLVALGRRKRRVQLRR